MAPFGKNFLKARLKNRTKDAEAIPGKEIQVTVCKEEKVVCGVTKHTTCADMVQALLEDHRAVPETKRLLDGDPRDFCLVERWKGFERALPPLTRILRLWSAWGDQRPLIQFVLVKTSDFVPQAGKKGLKPKGAKPKRLEQGAALQHSQSLPVERQKRMVKKAFRKLEKLHKESKSSPGTEEVDKMVQLILAQDHTIREQIQQMRDLDVEIERFEAEREGEATGSAAQQRRSQSLDGHAEEQLQEYLFTNDGVEQLEMQVQRHQELILQLSRDIDSELTNANLEWPQMHDEDGQGAAAPWSSAELETLQSELKHSLYTGVSLHTQTAELDKELKYYDATLVSKDQECWQLASQLSSMQVGDSIMQEQSCPGALKGQLRCGVSQAVKLKHSLSPTDVTDTDSDTGISSTHSQDSLSPCLDFPPPLDTDV